MVEAVRKKLPPGVEADPALGNSLNRSCDKQGIKENDRELSWPSIPMSRSSKGHPGASKRVLRQGLATIDGIQVDPAEAGGRRGDHRDDRRHPVRSQCTADGCPGHEDEVRRVRHARKARSGCDEATGLIRLEPGPASSSRARSRSATSAEGPPMMAIPIAFRHHRQVEMSDQMWEARSPSRAGRRQVPGRPRLWRAFFLPPRSAKS